MQQYVANPFSQAFPSPRHVKVKNSSFYRKPASAWNDADACVLAELLLTSRRIGNYKYIRRGVTPKGKINNLGAKALGLAVGTHR